MTTSHFARMRCAQTAALLAAVLLVCPVAAEPVRVAGAADKESKKDASNDAKTLAYASVPAEPIEPEVQTHRIDERGAEVDELRVRGQAQRIVVTPHNTDLPAYEIITGDGSRDLSFGASSTRGAAGKRVWHVLSF